MTNITTFENVVDLDQNMIPARGPQTMFLMQDKTWVKVRVWMRMRMLG